MNGQSARKIPVLSYLKLYNINEKIEKKKKNYIVRLHKMGKIMHNLAFVLARNKKKYVYNFIVYHTLRNTLHCTVYRMYATAKIYVLMCNNNV